jgi:hypothetical protein
MTKDEILSMAKEADLLDYRDDEKTIPLDYRESLKRFADLVAEKATEQANARQNASWALMCEKMVAAERQECVKILHDNATKSKGMAVHALIASAQQIEARGKK